MIEYTLYVKEVRGYFYLGKTVGNVYTYRGSGTDWIAFLESNNIPDEEINTYVLHKTKSKEELRYIGKYYSSLFNVVSNPKWANRTEEEGQGGSINSGKVGINKDGVLKIIPKKDLDSYIEEGWNIGYGDDFKNKKVGRTAWNKGLTTGPQSLETKEKKRLAKLGKKRPPRSAEWIKNMSLSRIGKKRNKYVK